MNATALCARSSAGVQLQQNATSATALSARSFAGVQLQQDARSLRVNKRAVCSAASKKMNSYDENWDKGECGLGQMRRIPAVAAPWATPPSRRRRR